MTATADEVVDSRGLFGHWAALRARIAADGYVFMRGLLDETMVRSVGRVGLAHLQDAGWTAPGHDPITAPPKLPVRAVKMRDAFGDPGYRRILADSGFNQIPFFSPVADLMAQLLGPAGFCYPLKLPRVVYPTEVVPHQPGNVIHKDYGSGQDMFTCWVPLGEVPRTLGGLALEPGSQHSTRVRYRPLDQLEHGWVSTDYQPGDVLVFHCLTTHAALPNREHRIRFSAEYRWQLADQPAPAASSSDPTESKSAHASSHAPHGGIQSRPDSHSSTTTASTRNPSCPPRHHASSASTTRTRPIPTARSRGVGPVRAGPIAGSEAFAVTRALLR